MCLVTWPLNESEAGFDLALIETSQLFTGLPMANPVEVCVLFVCFICFIFFCLFVCLFFFLCQ